MAERPSGATAGTSVGQVEVSEAIVSTQPREALPKGRRATGGANVDWLTGGLPPSSDKASPSERSSLGGLPRSASAKARAPRFAGPA